MGIKVKTLKGWSATQAYLDAAENLCPRAKIERICDEAIIKLKNATPEDEANTANQWRYEIKYNRKGFSLNFYNDNIQNGVCIALVMDKGHATKNGKWISGKHYLDKPVQETYEQIIRETWEELKRL